MAKELAPAPDARGHRFALVAARFHEAHVRRLVDAALDTLRGRGADDADLEVVWVPGAFEIPVACRWLAASGRFDALIACGVVIRGDTEHFRLVADTATTGIARVALDTGVPVLDAVLAVHDVAQADARTGGALGNAGAYAALAAVHMAVLRRSLG